MPERIKISFFSAAIFSLFLLISLAHAEEKFCLIVTDESGKTVLSEPMLEGDQFAIRFTHSVALTPVTDYYKVKNGKIFLDKTIYHDFGAGLPYNTEANQQMTAQNGEIILSGFERELPEFFVRVGRVANHRLLLLDRSDLKDEAKGKLVPFNELARPGQALHFSLSSSCSK